ncbi:MAG: hypothetical protein JSS86_19735 [Cyanobacteria bacterium SZAS LIN-2]|nr:hypothetical protein [Cyanobacteria bacterium SZAS LIN-2]
MKAKQNIAAALTLTFCLTLGQATQSARADNDNMRLGVSEYNAGAYSDALGHLQAALATDFQNPKLHYYLANTFVHLNSKDAGIREFRIAYALDPDKEVGKLSKQALAILGADESKPKETSKPLEKKPPSDPVLDKLNATLQKQAEQARNLDRGSSDQISELARRNQELLGRAKSDMQKDMSYYRRGRLIQLPLPDEALRQLDNLKRMYDAQKSSYLDGSAKHSDEIQKSADNLAGLLNEKGKAGSPKLVPEGTNLYIRNYKNEQSSTPPTKDKSSTQSTPAPAGK